VAAAAILEHVHICALSGVRTFQVLFQFNKPNRSLQANAINDVSVILSDTFIVFLTLYNTLGPVRRSREFQMLPQKSLSQTLAEQGRLIYHYALKQWTIASLGLIQYGSVLL
jgi:hypothetical protein